MLRKILLHAFISITSLIGYSQSINDKILNAINQSDWFSLDSIYNSVPKDSIHPYLEISSRCFLGHQFNRPEVSIPAFQELFSTQSEYLDLNNFITSAVTFGKDLSSAGQNEFAASMINQVIGETQQYLDSASVHNLTLMANWYSALAAYNPYQIQFNGDRVGKIPFTIIPFGPKEKGSVLMRLNNSTINGMSADIIFDTGAASNLITPEMAEKFKLTPIEGTKVSVNGIGQNEGYLAIAQEMQLGDITVKDVPFTVVSISSNNSEADQYADVLSIVIGSDLMLKLKELTIDFLNNNITVPSQEQSIPVKTDAKPNLCFSPAMNLLCRGTIHDEPMLMFIDTGDASFGGLGKFFFEKNKQYVLDNGVKDTVRTAGIGGVKYFDCYKVPNMKISLGNQTLAIPEMVVTTDNDAGAGLYEANIGLRTLMLYSFVRFNFVDFVMTTGIPRATKIK